MSLSSYHQLALKISSRRNYLAFETSPNVDYSDVPDRDPDKIDIEASYIWKLGGNRELRILSSGTKRWYKDGKLHREDGPALELANGDKIWYQNGWPHREDGPAFLGRNGTVEYWLNNRQIKTKSKNFNSPQFQKRWQKLLELERIRQIMED